MLEALLEASFTDEELRNLAVQAFHDGQTLSRALPGAGASARQLAWSVVTLMDRHYSVPPPSLWAYLYAARGGRRQEIDRIRVHLSGDGAGGESCAPPVTPVCTTAGAQEPREIIVSAAAHGSKDLLALFEVHVEAGSTADGSPGTLLQEHFPDLVPGRVNGLPRSFVITWTEQVVQLRVTPSLYQGSQRLPVKISLPVPVAAAGFVYYPCGRHDFRPETGGPRAYGISIETWSPRLRRLCLTSRRGAQLAVELRHHRK